MKSNDTLTHHIPPPPTAPASTLAHMSLLPVTDDSRHHHLVQFYERDDVLLRAVTTFAGEALRDGRSAVVIVTPEHRADIERLLALDGVDWERAARRGTYVALDADEVLARFMDGDVPDRERFIAVIEPILSRAISGHGHAHVFGEMVAVLVAQGNYPAAITLEDFWNELQERFSFSLLCGYPMNHGGGEALTGMFETVMAAHTHVVPAESYSALSTSSAQLREIAMLQQKALWLEREIAERRLAEERLREALASEQTARRETEAALALRDEFLSIAAHELKTPLTGMNGHVQLAARLLDMSGGVPSAGTQERVRRSLTVVGEQGRKLALLLDRLLDTARIEAGRLSLEPQSVDLTELVEQMVETTRFVSNGVSIVVEAPPALQAEVDPVRLEQVLANLLDNAMRYSPEGGRIDVRLAQGSPGWVELAVRDQGPGVPPALREHIFDRYYRLEHNGRGGGMGLGLHIANEIVDLHGGHLRLECPPEGGSVFVVSLPVHSAAAWNGTVD